MDVYKLYQCIFTSYNNGNKVSLQVIGMGIYKL